MPLPLSRLPLLAALVGALFSCAARASGCPPLELPAASACVASEQGWFYAASEAEATGMADAARQAAAEFERYFQHAPSRGAVVSIGSGGSISGARKSALEAQGAAWVLPWLGPDDKRRLAASRIRRQVEAQLGAGADVRVVDAAVAQALDKLPGGDNGTADSALRHEIGHMLLIRAFPIAGGDATPQGNAHGYGGGFPDWLDETAAVLLEDAAMAGGRRDSLARMLACGKQDRLSPLARFFSMEHPLAAIAGQLLSGGSGNRVMMLDDERGRALGERGSDFYVQARAFADFLIETSGDPTVFGSIARTLAAGGDMDGWLAREGSRHRLPGNVAALQDAWQAWLDRIAATAPACHLPAEGDRATAYTGDAPRRLAEQPFHA